MKVYGYVNIAKVVTREGKLDARYDLWMAPKTLMNPDPEDFANLYGLGYNPIDMVFGSEGYYVGWGLPRCYDCVAAGGTLDKPEFD